MSRLFSISLVVFCFVLAFTCFTKTVAQPRIELSQSSVTNMSISRDSRFLAVTYANQTLKIFTVPDGKLILSTHEEADPTDIAFSEDNLSLIVSAEKYVKFYSTRSGNLQKRISFSSQWFDYEKTCVAVGPDGNHMAFGERLFKVGIMDLKTFQIRMIAVDRSEYVWKMSYSPDGKFLYVAGSGGGMTRINTSDYGKTYRKLHNSYTHSMDIDAAGTNIITGYNDKTVKIHDAKTFEEKASFTFNDAPTSVSSGNRYACVSLLDGTIRVLDIVSKKEIRTIRASAKHRALSIMSGDDRFVFSGSWGSEIKTWSMDQKTGKMLSASVARVNAMDGNTDGKFVAVAYSNGMTKVWDLENLEVKRVFRGNGSNALSVSYHPVKNLLLIVTESETAVWDIDSGKKLRVVKAPEGNVTSAFYTANAEMFIGTDAGTIVKLDKSGNISKTMEALDIPLKQVQMHSSGKYLLAYGGSKIVAIELETGKKLYSFQSKNRLDYITAADFHPTRSFFCYSIWNDDVVYVADLEKSPAAVYNYPFRNPERKVGSKYKRHVGMAGSAFKQNGNLMVLSQSNLCFEHNIYEQKTVRTNRANESIADRYYQTKNGAYELFANENGALKVFRTDQYNQAMVSLLSGGRDEFVAYLDNGKYFGSREMIYKLPFTYQGNPINHTSLDLYYNRPDEVLRQVNPSDPTISFLEQVYKKRKQKLWEAGIEEKRVYDMSKVPEIQLDIDDVPLKVPTRELTFRIRVKRMETPVEEFKLEVNGVPVSKGHYQMTDPLPTAAMSGYNLHDVTLNLTEGENWIEISCRNGADYWSVKQHFIVYCEPGSLASSPKKLYFVGIGASDYESATDLTNAAYDVEELKKYYSSNPIAGYTLVPVTITGVVTAEQIKALKSQLKESGEEDMVLLYYAGHGTFDASKNYYLGTHQISFKQPEANGLPYEELENLLSDIRARKKVLFVNACYSGEFDKDQKLFEKMNYFFPDLRPGNGAYVFSSANADQKAWAENLDGEDLTAFGYSLLRALEHEKHLSVSSLNSVLNRYVREVALGQSAGLRRGNVLLDFNVK